MEPALDESQTGDIFDSVLASELDIINSNDTGQTKESSDNIDVSCIKSAADSNFMESVAVCGEEQAVSLPDGNLLSDEAKSKLGNKVYETLTLDIMSDDAVIQNCFSSPYGGEFYFSYGRIILQCNMVDY